MKTRREIKQQASEVLSAHYWPMVGIVLLFTVLIVFSSSATRGIGAFFLTGPLTVGLNMYCLRRWRGENATLESAFEDGFSNYGHVLGGYLYVLLFLVLWSLLFVIPGIIKSFSYAMTPYLLADCKEVSATDALKLSKRMMAGHKWELFVLHLSFIGWGLLNTLTMGILGIFYVSPYLKISLAGYYDERKKQALAEGVITMEELMGAPIQ